MRHLHLRTPKNEGTNQNISIEETKKGQKSAIEINTKTKIGRNIERKV